MRVAVVVHAFHKDSFKTIAKYLNGLTTEIDVFITGSDIANVINGPIKNLAAVAATENLGMDVLPFLYAIHKYKLYKYELVVKIHTKNCNTEESIRMMRIYLEHLLTDDALSVLKDSYKSSAESIGLWGPVAFARSVDKLAYSNRDNLRSLKQKIELYCSDEGAVFFAGNMFCIRGTLLKKLSENYYAIKSIMKADYGPNLTGLDGSLAHALERFVSSVIRNQSYETGYIFPKGCTSTGRLAIISEKLMPFGRYKRYLQAGSNDTSLRVEKISDYRKLDYNAIVNISQYADCVDPERVVSIDHVAHYIIFSDYLELPFGVEYGFSSAMYRLERLDVFRAGIPSPYHYLDRGRKERPELFTGIWVNKLIDKYLSHIPSALKGLDKITFHEQLKGYGQIDCKISGRQCSPLLWDSQDELVNRSSSVTKILEYHIPDLHRTQDIIKLQLEHHDFLGAGASAEEFANKAFLTPDLVEIIATAATMAFNWKAAAYYWKLYTQTRNNKNLLPSFGGGRLIKYDGNYDSAHIFREEFLNSYRPLKGRALPVSSRVCIYTSLFGDYDDLPEIQCEPPADIEFVAFTDRMHVTADKRWKQIVCKADGITENMSAKKYKLKPHVYLKEYDYSLFVDANTVFTGDLSVLVVMLHSRGPFVMWRHPLRTDLFIEACAIISSGRANADVILKQMATYAQAGIKHHTGLCEGSFIWRCHTDEKIMTFMDEWWSQIEMFSHRDQLSLAYLMWRDKYYPAIIDDSYGTSRENIFFYKKRLHKAECKS